MIFRSLARAITLAAVTILPAAAQPLDPALIVGSWKLTSIYDQFADGRKRETWGANPQGIIQFTANGIVSVQLTGGDRAPQPGSVPTDPVGPISTYFGTYTIDAATRSVEMKVQRSSWPQWNGATLKRSIEDLSPTTLKVVANEINDPKNGPFKPHLEFERIK